MKAPLYRIAARLMSNPWLMKPDDHQHLVAQFKAAVRTRTEREDDEYPEKSPQDLMSRHADMDSLRDILIMDGIAVLPVFGILGKHLSGLDMMCGGFDLTRLESQALALMNREDIHTVITHWNTPGGAAAGVAETAQILMDMGTRKRHLAYVDEACSGGYWLASTAQEILCGDSAVIGSISAVCAIEDLSQYYADMGVKVEVFTDGDQKGAGIPGTSLSETQRAGIQERVSYIGGMFKDFVKSRRAGLTDDLLQGQWFYGKNALGNGLADVRIISLEHALAYAIETRN